METFVHGVQWNRLIYWNLSPNIFSSKKIRRKYVYQYLADG